MRESHKLNRASQLLTGENINVEILTGDCAVKHFAPVTARIFRLLILEADKPVAISNLELYPPL